MAWDTHVGGVDGEAAFSGAHRVSDSPKMGNATAAFEALSSNAVPTVANLCQNPGPTPDGRFPFFAGPLCSMCASWTTVFAMPLAWMPQGLKCHPQGGPLGLFFFVKDRPSGPPRGTTNRQPPPTANRQPPPTANRHQPPTANRHQPPTANRHQPPTANRHQPPTANRQRRPTTKCHPPAMEDAPDPISSGRPHKYQEGTSRRQGQQQEILRKSTKGGQPRPRCGSAALVDRHHVDDHGALLRTLGLHLRIGMGSPPRFRNSHETSGHDFPPQEHWEMLRKTTRRSEETIFSIKNSLF